MSITTTIPAPTDGQASVSTGQQEKDWLDFLGGVLPGIASEGARQLGIDPRLAGQTVSSVLGAFGIGGPGKAFTPVVPQQEAVAKLKEVVAPHLATPGFAPALTAWLQAAVEPVSAQQQGKSYTADLDKSWFDDAIGTIGDAVSSVNWGQVAQVGMQALPFVLSVL